MSISLKEAMTIEPFSKAKLIAGKNGVNREVNSANIQEVPHVERWLHGGEIVFTAGFAFKNEEGGKELLTALSEKNAAALALKPGQCFDKVPEGMIRRANELNFPLFEIPEDLPYMDCILPIYEKITSNQIATIKRDEEIHNQMIQVMVNGLGIGGIRAVLSDAIKAPVFVASPEGLILSINSKQDHTVPGDEYIQDLFERCCKRSIVKKMIKNKCNRLSSGKGKEFICVPVYVKEELIAYLVLDTSESDVTQSDLLAIENASALIAVELLKEHEALAQERKAREQLLLDILANRYVNEDVMIRRGKFVGYDFTGRGLVFIFSPEGFEERIIGERAISERKIQRIKNEIQSDLENSFRGADMANLIVGTGMNTIGLVQTRDAKNKDKCLEILNQEIVKLDGEYKDLSFFAGIGRTIRGIQSVPDDLKEARYAMKAGRKMKDSKVTLFENLGCLSFLCDLDESEAERAFYSEYIEKLEKYDKENHGALVETLETYFLCGTNIRETSEKLFIHKNSVIYRLNKVEELLGKKLSDQETLFNIQLCLKLRMLR